MGFVLRRNLVFDCLLNFGVLFLIHKEVVIVDVFLYALECPVRVVSCWCLGLGRFEEDPVELLWAWILRGQGLCCLALGLEKGGALHRRQLGVGRKEYLQLWERWLCLQLFFIFRLRETWHLFGRYVGWLLVTFVRQVIYISPRVDVLCITEPGMFEAFSYTQPMLLKWVKHLAEK